MLTEKSSSTKNVDDVDDVDELFAGLSTRFSASECDKSVFVDNVDENSYRVIECNNSWTKIPLKALETTYSNICVRSSVNIVNI